MQADTSLKGAYVLARTGGKAPSSSRAQQQFVGPSNPTQSVALDSMQRSGIIPWRRTFGPLRSEP
jgi:hypothetical protein